MTQLIQLDPSSPPLHPMLPMFRKRVVKMSSENFRDDELKSFNEHLCCFMGINGFKTVGIGSPEALSGFVSAKSAFVNTSGKPSLPATTVKGAKYFIQAIDLSTGLLFCGNIPTQSSIIDVTGMPPYSEVNGFANKFVMLRLNGTLGVDLDWIVLLVEEYFPAPKLGLLSEDQIGNIRLLNLIFEDYQMQKHLAVRDYKYKAALIENLISSHPKLSFYIKTPKERSKAVFPFTTSGMSGKKFQYIMSENGFEVGYNTDSEGVDFILIANFINHSKEQFEAFVDAVNAEISF